ncbi:MAG: YcgN family cysteine cluster protein [Pseudomonadota bacterium]
MARRGRGRGAEGSKPAPALKPGFWREKTLEQLSPQEWEALCDGCGKCCLLKLEDEESGEVTYTSVACRLFDSETCRCGNYALRKTLVPQCMVLTPEVVRAEKDWMPRSCAYRLIADGYDLYAWHPLLSGDPNSVHEARISVQGWTTPEYEVELDELPDYAIIETL